MTDAWDFLAGLFDPQGPATKAPATDAAPVAIPEPVAVGPAAGAAPQSLDFNGWTCERIGGRLVWTAPGIAHGDWPAWGELPEPSGCPTCGGIACWFDLAGGRHCTACDAAALRRSRTLADKAAELRDRAEARRRTAPVAKPTPQRGPGRTQPVAVESQDLDEDRPAAGRIRDCGGCEVG